MNLRSWNFQGYILLLACYGFIACKSNSEQARTEDLPPANIHPQVLQPDQNLGGDTGNQEIFSEFRTAQGPTHFRAKTIDYGAGVNGISTGYYMTPVTGTAKIHPALILIHGIMGLSKKFKKNMQRFVAQGYQILAVDLYLGEVPVDASAARELQEALLKRGKIDTIRNITDASDYLFNQLRVKSLSVVGWDAGGSWAISTMLTFPASFASVVNFYGPPFELKGQESTLNVPMMHIFVHDDPSLDIKEIITLEEALKKLAPAEVVFRKFEEVAADFLEPSLSDTQLDDEDIRAAYHHTFKFLNRYQASD